MCVEGGWLVTGKAFVIRIVNDENWNVIGGGWGKPKLWLHGCVAKAFGSDTYYGGEFKAIVICVWWYAKV